MKTRYHKTLFVASGLFGLALLLTLLYLPSTVQARDRAATPYGYHQPRVSDRHWGRYPYAPPPPRYRCVGAGYFRPHIHHYWSDYPRYHHYRPAPRPHPYRDWHYYGR